MKDAYEWSLREEILAAAHRWPEIVAFGLVGVLLGWALALLWPVPYQATLGLNVGLNVYHIPEGQSLSGFDHSELRLVDDYKNWQLANLDTMVSTDRILDETLTRLRSQDEYWLGVDRDRRGEGRPHAEVLDHPRIDTDHTAFCSFLPVYRYKVHTHG